MPANHHNIFELFQEESLIDRAGISWWESGQLIRTECIKHPRISDIIEMFRSHDRGVQNILLTISLSSKVAVDSDLTKIISKDYSGYYDVNINVDGRIYQINTIDIIAKNTNILKYTTKILGPILKSADFGEITLRFSETFIFSYDAENTKFSPLYRGCSLPSVRSFTRETALSMSILLAEWIENNINDNGRLPYNIHTSNININDNGNNAIRQWMTTAALIKYSKRVSDAKLLSIADRNMRYNIKYFFEEIDDYGVISYDGSAKLGASALAALAVIELEGFGGPHERILMRLLKGIDRLWRDDGSFRTFFYPSDWNGNQNFYPGETLLLWSILMYRFGLADLKEKFLKSTEYYKRYFRRFPNPAFVPWHTMAQYYYYIATGDKKEVDFIFEMNDFICEIQERSLTAPKDVIGRFFDSRQASFGPPHASSTAVYLESLVYARRVAQDCGLSARATRYSQAIDAAFENLSCLQFKDRNELFYVAEAKVAWGGIRTNPYDNTIRIDNVQHALAACNALCEVTDAVSEREVIGLP